MARCAASSLIISLLPLLMAICLATWVCKAQTTSRYVDVQDLHDPQVTAAAEFAIYRHDIDSGSRLRLISIVSGEVQHYAGGASNYRLIIFAQDGVQINSYEVDVYVPNSRISAPFRLTGFIQIS